MRRKWIVKLGAPIIALGLVSACGGVNDNNDNTPQDTNYTPQNQAPENENLRYNDNNENENNMRNNNGRNTPDNQINDGSPEPYINNNNDKGAGPEHGTEPTHHLDNNRNRGTQ